MKKRTPEEKAYQRLVRSQPCIVAHEGCLYAEYKRRQSDCCHNKTDGSGGEIVGNTWPGCRLHHVEQGQIGIPSFEAKYGVNVAEACKLMHELFYQGEVVFP